MPTETLNVTATVAGGALAAKQDEQTVKLEQLRVLLAAAATTASQQAIIDAITALTLATPASPETGLAKEATLAAQSAKIPALTASGRLPVEAQPSSDLVAIDAFTAISQKRVLTVRPGDQQVVLTLAGTFSANVILQASSDGTNFTNLQGYNPATPTAQSALIAAPGSITAPIPAGTTSVQAIVFSFASGTVNSVLALGRATPPALATVETGLAKEATLAAQSAKLPAALSNSRLAVEALTPPSPAATTGTISGAGQFVPSAAGLAVPVGATSVAFHMAGAGTNWLSLQFSADGGTSWASLPGARVDAASTVTNVIAAGPGSLHAPLLPGATHVRVIVAAVVAGSNTVALAFGFIPLTAAAAVYGNVALSGGTAAIGTVSQVTPTPFALNSAATTNATSVKNAAGTLYTVAAYNGGAAAAFLKLFNKASAPTIPGDTPALTVPIPATSQVSLNLGALGHRFSAGIALAITNLAPDSDATVITSSQVKVLLDYV